jgi:hypothetical protein
MSSYISNNTISLELFIKKIIQTTQKFNPKKLNLALLIKTKPFSNEIIKTFLLCHIISNR